MNEQLFRTLLYESEGPALDFKRDQYAFIGADDQTKSKLLKDILTFANSWRRGDAYILIGIEALNDGSLKLVGVPPGDHIDDASLQQFVNSKTNRKVEFSYKAFLLDGLSFGVVTIPKQKRPVYAAKKFGIVNANEVYFRRGSSCAVATADDLYQMGHDDGKDVQAKPLIQLEFADLNQRRLLGGNLSLKTINHAPHKKRDFPDAESPSEYRRSFSISYVNHNYWRELADYTQTWRAYAPVGFAVTNIGDELAKSVRLEIESSKDIGLAFKEKGDMPTFPEHSSGLLHPTIPYLETREEAKGSPEVREYDDRWLVHIPFGDIQPKSTSWARKSIFIEADASGNYVLSGRLYADNISHPQNVKVGLNFEIEIRSVLTLDELHQVDGEEREELREICKDFLDETKHL